MNDLEEAVLVLKNDGEFYKTWLALVSKYGAKQHHRTTFRNTILDYLRSNGVSYRDTVFRERVRIEIAQDWGPFENPVPAPQPVEVQQPTKEKEQPMAQKGIAVLSVEIKTVTYLNNVDIKTLTKEQLIDAIAQCEADLKRMSELTTKSKAIDAKREAIKATINQLVSILDQE